MCEKIADFFCKIIAKFFPYCQLIIPLTVFYQNQVFHIFLLFGDIYGKNGSWECLITGSVSQTQSACAEINDGRMARKAKIMYLIFTVLVGIATIVSAIFAVLTYLKM